MRSHSIGGVLLGLLLGLSASCGSSSNDSGDAGAGSESATGTQGTTQTANTAVTSNNGSSASEATATATTSADAGSTSSTSSTGGSSTSSTAASTTGVGGAAGNANATSNTTSAGAGGSGGDAGEVCPDDPPVGNTPCERLGLMCAYEDCAGTGRSVANCTQGSWIVDTAPCGDTVSCNGGSEICAAGEVCLIMAGGAFLQNCVPNTCDGEAVECDCIEGCFDDCPVFAQPETGVTITCNTCPSGMCP